MKICHVVCQTKPYSSGMSNAALRLATGAIRFGHKVALFAPRYDESMPMIENYHGTEILRLRPLFKYGNAAALPQLLFRLKNFDIVDLHFPFFGSHELIWFDKKVLKQKFKLILQYHMNADQVAPALKPLLLPTRLIFNSLIDATDIILCSSLDYINSNFSERLINKFEYKIREVPFGVDICLFTPLSLEDHITKPLLFVGALDKAHDFKGLDILLTAMSKLDNKVELKVIGGGDRETYYREMAKKLGLDNRVLFTGKIPDANLISQMQGSSLLVLPSTSKQEAFGIVIIEAMACGLPVIASDLLGVRTVFSNGREGYLTEPGSVDSLKEKVDMILSDRDLYRRMSQSARELAVAKYSESVVNANLNNIYLSLNEDLYNQ